MSGTEMQALIDALAETDLWADATFPGSSDHARLSHLREEVAELVARPHSREELADCLMLLSHLLGAREVATLVDAIRGRVLRDVAADIERKLAICKARTWSAPDANGVAHHVKDGEAAR